MATQEFLHCPYSGSGQCKAQFKLVTQACCRLHFGPCALPRWKQAWPFTFGRRKKWRCWLKHTRRRPESADRTRNQRERLPIDRMNRLNLIPARTASPTNINASISGIPMPILRIRRTVSWLWTDGRFFQPETLPGSGLVSIE